MALNGQISLICKTTMCHNSAVREDIDTSLGKHHPAVSKYNHTRFRLNPVQGYRDIVLDVLPDVSRTDGRTDGAKTASP